MSDIAGILEEIAARMAEATERGKVADYIPELAEVDPGQFGIAVVLADGTELVAGDAATPFSIQSISKVFALALALGRLGDRLWQRVGREPSGYAFNSILRLEQEKGIPRNPFINAGAIVVTDAVLAGHAPREYLGELLRFIRMAADDDDIHINRDVAKSETETGHRNFALAHYKAFGNLQNPPDRALGAYFHQCAIEMSCLQLARAGRFLMGAEGGKLVAPERVRPDQCADDDLRALRRIGEFAFRVGLPGKSGVGGGILVIAPGRASIAVWSPGLNDQGNSLLGTAAVEISRPPRRLVGFSADYFTRVQVCFLQMSPPAAARKLHGIAIELDAADIDLVVRRPPDLAVIGAVALRHHVDDDLLAEVRRLVFAAALERLQDHAAEGRATGRDRHMGIGAVVFLCLPDAFHGVGIGGRRTEKHGGGDKVSLHLALLPEIARIIGQAGRFRPV